MKDDISPDTEASVHYNHSHLPVNTAQSVVHLHVKFAYWTRCLFDLGSVPAGCHNSQQMDFENGLYLYLCGITCTLPYRLQVLITTRTIARCTIESYFSLVLLSSKPKVLPDVGVSDSQCVLCSRPHPCSMAFHVCLPVPSCVLVSVVSSRALRFSVKRNGEPLWLHGRPLCNPSMPFKRWLALRLTGSTSGFVWDRVETLLQTIQS